MRLLRAALLCFAVLLGTAGAAAAAPAAAPAPGQTLTAAPQRIEVAVPAGTTGGTARVLGAGGQVVAHGSLGPAGPGELQLPVPHLGSGSYLVTWAAGGAKGSFGFGISTPAAGPALVNQPKATFSLGPLQDNLVAWLPLALVMILVGTLGLRLLVTRPAARDLHAEEVLATTDRRLIQVAAVAAILLVPAEIASFAYQPPQWDFGGIWSSLGVDGAGHVEGGRIALTIIAALALLPLLARRVRATAVLTTVALVCGLGELVGREVPTSVPPDWPRTIFTTVLYCFHLFAGSVWIGGLAALVALLAFRGVPVDARAEFWVAAIRRFSTIALVSVGVLVLTGLWLFWVHISGIHQLLTTLYGQTLVAKLIVVAVLVAIGAANQFWLLPLLDSRKAIGDGRGLVRTVMGHLRTVVAVEVALGLGVLFIAALLAGSARNEAFQTSPQALAQTATATTAAGPTNVELYPSAMQPGLLDYNVQLTGGPSPKAVVLTFSSSQLGAAAQSVTATAIGNGTYRVTGYDTPVVGDWQVAVSVDGGAPATFAFPVTTEAATPGKAAAPDVRWTTWLAGILETLLVAAVLTGAVRISRRLSSDRTTVAQVEQAPPAVEAGLLGV